MTSPPFPLVGVFAPMVLSVVLWSNTGSSFALLGAVLAPTMVVAHFLDARRRARKDHRAAESARVREEALRREDEAARRRIAIGQANRVNPSIAQIAESIDWLPSRDGRTTLRAGSLVDGSPWLVESAGGVAVIGDGDAAVAVWESLTVHATAQFGPPLESGTVWCWSNGVVLSHSSDTVSTVIRCRDGVVESITERGSIPVRGEWYPDDIRRVSEVRARLTSTTAPALNIALSDDSPHVLVAGRTGSGKSRALSSLVRRWCYSWLTSEFVFVGIDFKGGATLSALSDFPHHVGTVTDLVPHEVPRALSGIAAEMRRREAELSRQRVRSIEFASGIPRLAIVIDEVHELIRQFPHAHDFVADVARRGRSLGVHLVLAVQHPTGVLRDSVLGNIPVRVCFAMNTTHDAVHVLGRAVTALPSPGNALVVAGDGIVRECVVADLDELTTTSGKGLRPAPLWRSPLREVVPREGRPGFGLLDDVEIGSYRLATWTPSDGDVWVVGQSMSGKTSALRHLVAGRVATWFRSHDDLANVAGDLLVIDDLDVHLRDMSATDSATFLSEIQTRRRSGSTVLVSSAGPLPRMLTGFRDTLTLRLATVDEHRATGAPPETFDPASAPGMGTWRGLRVACYASTDSIDTASIE